MIPIKVSVIVAVFNAETTLPRCLDSLAAQTLQEMEFICVDDGSTDHSPKLLDTRAEKDSRFRVFHKANEGVSAARQFGMEQIRGEYVIHLDADDYVEPFAYEHMYEAAAKEHADMVICDAKRITNEGTTRMSYRSDDYSAPALINRMFSWETSALWNRLVRSELVSRYALQFPENLQLAEDRFWLVCLLSRSIKAGDQLHIIHLDEALIHYDQTANPASLTQNLNPKKIYAHMAQSYHVLIDQVDMVLFGRGFYTFILSMAFDAFWKQHQNDMGDNEYQNLFGPFEAGLRKYAPDGYRKALVIIALNRGLRHARRLKWIAIPGILRDKINL